MATRKQSFSSAGISAIWRGRFPRQYYRGRCTGLVLAASEKTITDILGSPDDMKFRSYMTLFDAVSKLELFAVAIAAFYPDGKDRATLEILEMSRSL